MSIFFLFSCDLQEAAIDICESLTDSLKKLSDEDAGFQNVQKGASNLVVALGQVAIGSAEDVEPSSGGPNNASTVSVYLLLCIVVII